MEFFRKIDYFLLRFINEGLSNEFFDFLMPYWRDKLFWIPLYFVVLILILLKYKRRAWIPVILILLTITVSDYVSSSVIKPLFERARPCQMTEAFPWLHVLINCGGGLSFTSSHATNHFAIATVFTFFIGSFQKWIGPLLYIWAASVAFGQVYVGVHYPSDIAAGALLGISISFLLIRLYKFAGRKFPNLAVQ